jgi:predicted RNA binding protein YcfA (HicA-like mRNA interferase family)
MLDRDGALHLADDAHEYGSWPDLGDADAVHPIDFDSLGRDTSQPSDSAPDFVESPRGIHVAEETIDAVLSGPNRLRGRDNAVLPPDVLGWYQPIHFFASNWGIFIRESALVDLARDLAPRFAPFIDRRPLPHHVAVLVRAAFGYVFLHEHYHHKIESLAIRLHIIERRPIYPDYMKFAANILAGTDDDTEEALAGADAYLRVATSPYSGWFQKDEREVVRGWMLDLFRNSPPGYQGAEKIALSPPTVFESTENYLLARVQEAVVNPSRPFPSDFSNATNLTRSFFNIKQSIWSIVPVGQEPLLPMLPGALPLKTDNLERYILKEGWERVHGAGKGSHAKYRRCDGGMIVLPHSKDVSRVVLSTAAQTLGLRPKQLVELAR